MDLTFQLGLLLVIPLPHEVQGQLFQMGDHQLLDLAFKRFLMFVQLSISLFTPSSLFLNSLNQMYSLIFTRWRQDQPRERQDAP